MLVNMKQFMSYCEIVNNLHDDGRCRNHVVVVIVEHFACLVQLPHT